MASCCHDTGLDGFRGYLIKKEEEAEWPHELSFYESVADYLARCKKHRLKDYLVRSVSLSLCGIT